MKYLILVFCFVISACTQDTTSYFETANKACKPVGLINFKVTVWPNRMQVVCKDGTQIEIDLN